MARRRARVPLNVFLDARPVGQLTRAADGAVGFSYDRTWMDRENAFAVSLSLPLRDARYTGGRVDAVFENLLPNSLPIRRRVAERLGAAGTDAYSMLAEIGRDCVGALQFPPEITGMPLDDAQIGTMLRNLARGPLGLDEEDDFRISVADAQETTPLLRHEGRWLKPTGTTP